MSDGDGTSDDGTDEVESVDTRRVDPAELRELREDIEEVADDLEEKTRNREALEADLRRYVRWRQRKGHARGWGPYLVLLYGTIMTLGAFYFLSGGVAILAMIVVWLSTLGLYALMLIVGLLATAIGLPGRAAERLRNLR
jgi:Flp pilus assembly protein TadB